MDLTEKIVSGLVVFILAAALVPTAMYAVKNANTTGWSSSETTVFGTFGILFLVGILMGIIYLFVKK